MSDLSVIRRAMIGASALAFLGIGASLRSLHRPAAEWTGVASLGLTVAPRSDPPSIMVESLRDDGPARRAGVMVGDLLEDVDGRPVRTVGDIEQRVEHRAAVDLRVSRAGDQMDVVIRLRKEPGRGTQSPSG